MTQTTIKLQKISTDTTVTITIQKFNIGPDKKDTTIEIKSDGPNFKDITLLKKTRHSYFCIIDIKDRFCQQLISRGFTPVYSL